MNVLDSQKEGIQVNVRLVDSVQGGTKPYKFQVVSGVVPAGLKLGETTGVLSGIPASGSANTKPYTFAIKVTDSSSPQQEFNQWYQLKVEGSALRILPTASTAPEPVAPPAAAPSSYILATSASVEETITVAENATDYVSTRASFLLDHVTQPIPGSNPPKLNADDKPVMTNVQELIDATLNSGPNAPLRPDDYCIIHIIRWRAAKEGKSDPERERWLLFEAVNTAKGVKWHPRYDPKFRPAIGTQRAFDKRIFGRKRVAVLLLHLNTPAAWDIKYKVTVTEKISQLEQDFRDLFDIVAPRERALAAEPKNVWGARLMLVQGLPVDMAVKTNISTGGQPVEQSKEYANVYDNEGRSHIAVSIGLPVKSIKELSFESKDGRVTTTVKERQNAYGFLNVFFNKNGVDLKNDGFLSTPHLVVGVPISGKPLDRPVVGFGVGHYRGPIKFNLFGGIVFNRVREPKTLNVGDAATESELEGDFSSRRIRKFIFGVNFPIRQIKDALSK
ncbi:MAG: Ig domain-containing protein [Acidobacteria bacterium]|nr:Ig domain-containing protein [Acidobacteriota bacterium]MCA1627055.1 Ig domain-containing protein [Acidobacteriota bacterium]